MKKILALIIIVVAIPAFGANKFVTPAGAGSQSGADWSNALPGSFTPLRGNTYYIADGSYSSKTWSTANSGTTRIILKKCTTADGVSSAAAGYNSTLCDGQAIFGEWIFTSDYWEMDGQKRNESSWNNGPSYGFKTSGVTTNALSFGHASDNVTIRYTDIGGDYGNSYNPSYGTNGIYLGGFTEVAEHWLFHKIYLHNVITAGQMAGVDDVIVEYSWIGPNWQKTGFRHQVRGSNAIYRYNVFKNACQGKPDEPGATSCTAILGWYGNSGSNGENYSNSKVYGNLFWDTLGTIPYTDACIFMGDNRSSQGGGPQNCDGCAIYNNTFAGMGANYSSADYGNCGLKFEGTRAGSEARNNIWFNIDDTITLPCTAATCSDNAEFTTAQSGIFVNAAAGNFHLSSNGAAGAGRSLPTPYNLDMEGTTRGADGLWDRGAFEAGTTTANNPAPPSGLTAVVQ